MRRQIRKSAALALALILSLGLTAVPVRAAEDAPQRGAITYTEPIAPQYEDARIFSDGLAAVKKDGKWGYIDAGNNVVIDFQFDVVYSFNEGKAIVGNYAAGEDGEELLCLGFVTADGGYTPFELSGPGEDERTGFAVWTYDEPEDARFSNGVVSFTMGEDYDGVSASFRSDGALITREHIVTGPANEGLIPIQDMYFPEDHDWDYDYNVGAWINLNGAVVHAFRPEYYGPEYSYTDGWGDSYTDQSHRHIYLVGPFDQKLAPAWQADYNAETGETVIVIGFIDRDTFGWAIPPQYENYMYSYGDNSGPYRIFGGAGLAMVEKDGSWGAIDKSGRTVIPFEYECLHPVWEGLIAFQQDGKWGYLDAETYGVAIPAQYEQATGFSGGLAVVYDGTRAFLIDKKNNPVPGADTLDPSIYFRESGGCTNPGEYVVIQRDGWFGFGRIEYLPGLPEAAEMDDWAYDEVVAAIEAGLVPADLQNLYHSDITRMEFCRVAVRAVEAALGQDVAEVVRESTGRSLSEWQNEYPFTDTANRSVIAAYALGIVVGNDNGTFAPSNTISRQEAAVMLTRAARVIGLDTDSVEGTVFDDGDQAAGWAVEAMSFVSHYGIMLGKGEGAFDPQGTFTREQSYMTALRMLRAAGE